MANQASLLKLFGAYGNIESVDISERKRIANVVFSLSNEGHLLMSGTPMVFGVTGTLEPISLIQKGSV